VHACAKQRQTESDRRHFERKNQHEGWEKRTVFDLQRYGSRPLDVQVLTAQNQIKGNKTSVNKNKKLTFS
jgi:hypothetical protein